MKHLLLLFALTIVFTSCGIKDVSKKKSPSMQLYTHGDPAAMIQGALLNRKSFLTNENIYELKNYYLYGSVKFIEKELKAVEAPKRQAQIENENRADNTDKTVSNTYHDADIEDINDGHVKVTFYYYQDENKKNGKVLEFKKNASGEYEVEGKNVLHYSLKEDKTAFSLLFEEITEDRGKVLTAYYFLKKKAEEESFSLKRIVSSFYNYLNGSGVAIGWDQSQTLEAGYCGDESVYTNGELVNDAFTKWQVYLTEDRLKINLQSKTIYPPFSDMNSNCTYFADSYLTIPEHKENINPGFAITLTDMPRGKIISSTVFILEKEIDKYYGLGQGDYNIQKKKKGTLIHEIGHFLGLDHKGLGGDDQTSSIMSYSRKSNDLTDYDIQAIQELYPIIETEETEQAESEESSDSGFLTMFNN